MYRNAIYNDVGEFMGYVYSSNGSRFYAPVAGVSDSQLSGYCDAVLFDV